MSLITSPLTSCSFPSPLFLSSPSLFFLGSSLTQSLDTLPSFLIPPPQFLCFHSACCPLFQLSVHCKKYLNRRSHFENSSPLAGSRGWGGRWHVAKQHFHTLFEGPGLGSVPCCWCNALVCKEQGPCMPQSQED